MDLFFVLFFYSLTTVEKPKETQTPAEKCSETQAAKTALLSNPITVSVSNWLNQKYSKKQLVYITCFIFILTYSGMFNYICR